MNIGAKITNPKKPKAMKNRFIKILLTKFIKLIRDMFSKRKKGYYKKRFKNFLNGYGSVTDIYALGARHLYKPVNRQTISEDMMSAWRDVQDTLETTLFDYSEKIK